MLCEKTYYTYSQNTHRQTRRLIDRIYIDTKIYDMEGSPRGIRRSNVKKLFKPLKSTQPFCKYIYLNYLK